MDRVRYEWPGFHGEASDLLAGAPARVCLRIAGGRATWEHADRNPVSQRAI